MGFGLLTNAFNKAFIPWLYESLRLKDLTANIRIVKITWIYFLVILTVAGFNALFSHWIVLVSAGKNYLEASDALVWIALSQAFGGMYFMVTNYLFSTRHTFALARVTLATGGRGILPTWYLAPRMGIAGAGLAFAIAMAARFFITWGPVQRTPPLPWLSVFRQPTLSEEKGASLDVPTCD